LGFRGWACAGRGLCCVLGHNKNLTTLWVRGRAGPEGVMLFLGIGTWFVLEFPCPGTT